MEMTPETQKRRSPEEIRRIRQIRRKRARRRKIIRLCIYLAMLIIVPLSTLGACKILIAKELPNRENVSTSQVIITDEGALSKPTPEPETALPEDHPTETPILVNKENPLPEDYEVDLITLPDGRSKAAEEAYEPLCEMLAAGKEAGLNLMVCSSYRDKARQEELFDEDVQELLRQGYTYMEAYEEVAKETMPPGCSEHSTGLAFDIVARDYQMLDKGQEKTAENKWLKKHCAEYGFILRYPEGKEDITDISYESWHFRYVGKEVAEYIMEKGITLEEYLEEL